MPPSQLSATGVMLLATKVLTARCVRKKVEKDVAADAAQERDTMAEVVDLRAKDMGVKGAVAAEEEGIKREVKEIIFLTITHVCVIYVRIQDIWQRIVLMRKSLVKFSKSVSLMMVEISSARKVLGTRMLTARTGITVLTVLC